MQPRNGSWFVACAIGNGLAASGALAAAARGNWIVALTSLVGSMVFAGGMIRTRDTLSDGRSS